MKRAVSCFLFLVLVCLIYSRGYDGVSPDSCSVNGFHLTGSIAELFRVCGNEYHYSEFDLSDNQRGFALQHTYKYDSALFIFVETNYGTYPDLIQLEGSEYTFRVDSMEYHIGDPEEKLAQTFPGSWEVKQTEDDSVKDDYELFILLFVTYNSRRIEQGSIRFKVTSGRVSEILIRYKPA
jgi:hypothetical protein